MKTTLIKFLTLVFIIIATSCLSKSPSTLSKGLDAVRNGDYENAVAILMPLAKNGNTDALYHMGYLYANGFGVVKDYAQAINFYTKAAQQRHPSAAYNLAGMYVEGLGVAKDPKKAVHFLRIAALGEHPKAQHNLSLMYASGEGMLQKDESMATRWSLQAALNGHPVAQYNMGFRYAHGDGVSNNEPEALGWYRKAAEQYHPAALNNLGVMYANGRGGVTHNAVVAYALYSVSLAKDNSADNPAQKNLQNLRNELSSSEVSEAEALSQAMLKFGNFLKALDAFNKQ